jgi:hypothetical protein
MSKDIIIKLREPFTFNEIEWKVQVTTADKARGMAVAYVDSRAIQKRLDETVGLFGWSNEFQAWHENSQICKLSIYCEDRREWVTKSDGAENTDFEPVKGGLSHAFKRVASLWGIGRYLYELEGIWVEVEQKGKSSVIKQNQFKVLETAYNQAVARIFGAAPVSGNIQSHTRPYVPPQSTQTQEHEQHPTLPQSGGEHDYTIQSVKPSGNGSSFLVLSGIGGKRVTAYVRSDNSAMKEGASLRNVKLTQKKGAKGHYNVIEACDVLDAA